MSSAPLPCLTDRHLAAYARHGFDVVGLDAFGSLTLRNRFVVTQVLRELANALAHNVNDRVPDALFDDPESLGDGPDPEVRLLFPGVAYDQSRSWWLRLAAESERLAEGIGSGLHANPRTPGEEALLAVATRSEYAETFRDDLRHEWEVMGRQPSHLGPVSIAELYHLLPGDFDEDVALLDEMLGDLAQDEDVMLVWEPGYADVAFDPGDIYALDNWLTPFGMFEDGPVVTFLA